MNDLSKFIGKEIIRFKSAVRGEIELYDYANEPLKLVGIVNGQMKVQLHREHLGFLKKSANVINGHKNDSIQCLLDEVFTDDGWMEMSKVLGEPKTALSELEGKHIHQVKAFDEYHNGFTKGKYQLIWARKYHMSIKYLAEVSKEITAEERATLKEITIILDCRYCNPDMWEEITI